MKPTIDGQQILKSYKNFHFEFKKSEQYAAISWTLIFVTLKLYLVNLYAYDINYQGYCLLDQIINQPNINQTWYFYIDGQHLNLYLLIELWVISAPLILLLFDYAFNLSIDSNKKE